MLMLLGLKLKCVHEDTMKFYQLHMPTIFWLSMAIWTSIGGLTTLLSWIKSIHSLYYSWIFNQCSHRDCGLIGEFSIHTQFDMTCISPNKPFLFSFFPSSGPAVANPFMVHCQAVWFWKGSTVFWKWWKHSKVLLNVYHTPQGYLLFCTGYFYFVHVFLFFLLWSECGLVLN